MEASRRLIQFVRIFLLVSIMLYAGIAWMLPSSAHSNAVVFQAVTVVAVAMVLMIFGVRRLRLRPAEEGLLSRPDDPPLLRRWREGYLLIYIFSEAIALYGIALHFLGHSFGSVVPFFLGGFVLILFFRPTSPVKEFPSAASEK